MRRTKKGKPTLYYFWAWLYPPWPHPWPHSKDSGTGLSGSPPCWDWASCSCWAWASCSHQAWASCSHRAWFSCSHWAWASCSHWAWAPCSRQAWASSTSQCWHRAAHCSRILLTGFLSAPLLSAFSFCLHFLDCDAKPGTELVEPITIECIQDLSKLTYSRSLGSPQPTRHSGLPQIARQCCQKRLHGQNCCLLLSMTLDNIMQTKPDAEVWGT